MLGKLKIVTSSLCYSMTFSMKGWSSEALLMTSKGKKICSALEKQSSLKLLYPTFLVLKTSHPVRLRTSPFSSNQKEIQMHSSLLPLQTQLRFAILNFPIHMEELAAIDHHLFLLFLHKVHAVFVFQIIYNMGNNMQYLTCCWCLPLSFVDAHRTVFSSQRSAKRLRLTMRGFLITQPQCWGQDKGLWMQQQRGIEEIN